MKNKFNIGDKVIINVLKLQARIVGIYISKDSLEYNVRFFDGNKTCTCYLWEDELSLEDSSQNDKQLGFQI